MLAMTVSGLFIGHAWTTALTRHGGNIDGRAFGLGIAAAVAVAATAIIAGCVLKRSHVLRTGTPPPSAAPTLTVTLALLAPAAVTCPSILLGKRTETSLQGHSGYSVTPRA